jgi:hypothetical protein
MGQQQTHDEDVDRIYRTPERGEDHLDKDLPLGWLADSVSVPDGWDVDFIERGSCLRFRTRVDRDKYGLSGPGWPGVGITSGRDYWAIIGDSDRVLRDVWHDPDDEPSEVVKSVVEAIAAVESDLERVRLESVLDGVVPSHVVGNLIDRFGTAERVAEIEDDTPLLESVDGIGPERRKAVQQRYMLRKMGGSGEVEVNNAE